MEINRTIRNKNINCKNELEKKEVNKLKVLYNSLTPEKVIKQKIINEINKNAIALVNGESVVIEFDLKKFNSAHISKIEKQFRNAGFKTNSIIRSYKQYLKIKL